jgi:polyhydroxyalkanoate synthesis repressor PhaR
MVTIKKYGNRRLYDTETSRYVTLDELAERVRTGTNVRVEDAKTHEDLTQSTLAQIILESRGASSLLPVPLLVQLIRLGDDALADFFGRYVSAALEMYLQARHGMQAMQPFYNPFAAAMGPGAFGMPAPAATPPAADDIATLRRELDELKRAVSKKKKRG